VKELARTPPRAKSRRDVRLCQMVRDDRERLGPLRRPSVNMRDDLGSLLEDRARLRRIVRLHIIGVPSAGKTTLARDIATRLGVPHYDLDSLAFVDDRWTLRPTHDRDAMLARILEEPSFVTEGGFLGWTEALFAETDHIIWLDPPLWVLVGRHVRRHWRHPLLLPSLIRFQVLMYLRLAGAGPAKDDPNLTRRGIESALRRWADKVDRVVHPTSASDLINGLTCCRSRSPAESSDPS
jgi:adenylate kinase family enzyme